MTRLLVASVLLMNATASAQVAPSRVEVGGQFTTLDTALGEKPLGAGGRITIRVWRFFDAEAEVNRFAVGGEPILFPGTQVLVGTRAGYRLGPIGFFLKARPGLIAFDGNERAPRLGTRFVLDLGAIVEFYSQRHFAFRGDFGDTAVFYGGDAQLLPFDRPGTALGTRHQFQASAGVSVWF